MPLEKIIILSTILILKVESHYFPFGVPHGGHHFFAHEYQTVYQESITNPPTSSIPITKTTTQGLPPYIKVPMELKPSITGWDTQYNVPCGIYKIHPFVIANLRYSSRGTASRPYYRGKRSLFFPPIPPLPEYSVSSTSCTWQFKAVGECKLKFSCEWFQLPALFRCNENYMELTDSDNFSHKFCGNRKPRGAYVSSTEEISLKFKSESDLLPTVFDCSVACVLEMATKYNLSAGTIPVKTNIGVLASEMVEVVAEKTTTSTTMDSISSFLVPPPILLKQDENCLCGVGVEPVGRIVGGREVELSEFPWAAALVRSGSNRPFCGATLINDLFLVTAAHCLLKRRVGRHFDDGPFEVVLNEIDFDGRNEVESSRMMRYRVSRIEIHPKYDNGSYDYDIALLRLENPISLQQPNVSASRILSRQSRPVPVVPICLPSRTQRTLFDGGHVNAVVAGWGLTKEGGVPSSKMLKAEVQIFNESLCREFYHNGRDLITDRMICAGHQTEMIDSCVGDSGGGLIVNLGDRNVLAGIVSWGRGCGRQNLPGVYTKISGLNEWIVEKSNEGTWCMGSSREV